MSWSSWFRRTLLKDPEGSQISDSTTKPQSEKKKKKKHHQQLLDDELEQYGITQRLIDHIKTFSVDTFKNFPVRDDDGDLAVPEGRPAPASGNIRTDLSQWQERHATLLLSKVKEISRLRFLLCPRHFKEREFWSMYFVLVKSYISEYELGAVRLEKLKTMAREEEKSSNNSWEVEMLESNTQGGGGIVKIN